MTRLAFVATLVSLLTTPGCTSERHGASDGIRLVGAGDPAVDLPALQDAMDRFDAVAIEGVFALGDTGRVVIRRPVELRGEEAVLRGGLESITIRNAAGGRVLLEDLTLEGATGTAILYLEGADLEVRNVRVLDVAPGLVYREIPASVVPGGITGRLGLVAWDWDAGREAAAGRIRGRIVVRDSRLDLSRPASPYSRAIVTVGGDADVEITDTVIRDAGGANTVGVEVFLGNRTVTLERNEIVAGLLPVGVFGSRGPVNLGENSLRLTGENAGRGVGLMLATHADSAGEVAENRLQLEAAAAGIVTGFDSGNPLVSGPIRIPYRNGTIRENTISGTLATQENGEAAGIVLGYESRGNRVEDNDLGGLAAGEAGAKAPAVRLDPGASGNVIRTAMPGDSVLDRGSGNRVER